MDILDKTWELLCQFRKEPGVLHDPRDASNYHGHHFISQRDVLRRQDPTGLSEAMLLMCMCDATIDSVTVSLSDLLNNPGFFEQLKQISELKSALKDDFSEQMSILLEKASTLTNHQDTRNEIPLREFAICLRDAVMSIESNVLIRWVRHAAGTSSAIPMHLSSIVYEVDDLHAFLHHLRTDFPYGAFLVKVGEQSAIALVTPEQVAYVSSMSIDIHSGSVVSAQSGDSLTKSKRFHIDDVTQHYPCWDRLSHTLVPTKNDASQTLRIWGTVQQLPRDVMLWNLMMVEIITRQPCWLTAEPKQLVESFENARPCKTLKSLLLPSVCEPEWTAREWTWSDVFEALELTSWEQGFIHDGITGMLVSDFLPHSNEIVYLHRQSRMFMRASEINEHIGQQTYLRIIGFDHSMVGYQKEVEDARRNVLLNNIKKWIIFWGNQRFKELWKLSVPTFLPWAKKRINFLCENQLCVWYPISKLEKTAGIHLYEQNSKRVNYSPLCVLDRKTEAVYLVVFFADTAAGFAEALGVEERHLPVWLHGWKRKTGTWSTKESCERGGWCFSNNNIMSISITVGSRGPSATMESLLR